MIISSDFQGGNIIVSEVSGDTVYLDRDMRDSSGDWFYWAFSVSGAVGRRVTFRFPRDRIGYFGPAVSHDLINWHWLGCGDVDSFTYTFGEGEEKVYFAHHILYPEERLEALSSIDGISCSELCVSKKGRSVPYYRLGGGERKILLTARHHACESTGSYVLEGVALALAKEPIENTELIIVPYVDYDGVIDADQGKSRRPHDHNRDYDPKCEAIYPETAAIREIGRSERIVCAFDFHSPYHKGERHDHAFIVQKAGVERLERFGDILAETMTAEAFRYDRHMDIAPGVEWNNPDAPTFASYMINEAGADIAFTLETAYFGTEDNVASADGFIELGRCFATALRKYMEN